MKKTTPTIIYSKDEIRTKALKILEAEYGCDAWRQNNIAVRGRTFIGRKGVADILGFTLDRGIMVMCEVKALGDTFKPEQIELLQRLHNSGGVALVATQDDLKVIVKPFIQYHDQARSPKRNTKVNQRTQADC